MFGLGHQAKRQRMLKQLSGGPLQLYYASPAIDKSLLWQDASYLAVDIETTGLEPKTDSILSIGYVTLQRASIQLNTAVHQVINGTQAVAQSATIHGLTDDEIAAGLPLEEVLESFLLALKDKVLLAHHSVIETRFLSQACQQLYGAPLLSFSIDTLKLEQRLVTKGEQQAKEGDLRLDAARQRYQLPRYKAHNALTDAIACAELFLAQAQTLAGRGNLRVSQLLSWS